MYEYLLPIGSVVRLKGAEKELMIYGLLQMNPKITDKTFDYIGVPFPQGHFDTRLHLGFDHGDIDEVLFKGYQSENWAGFMAALEIVSTVQRNNIETAQRNE